MFNAAGNFYGSGYYFWTCAEYSAYYAFFYYGSTGTLNYGGKNFTISCRGLLALDF